jgi:hypothetical protein
MFFSLLVGDKEPLSCMGGYAPKHAGVVVGPAGPGKNQEELFYVVHYHKNPISFFDFHVIRHSAQNQPKVIEPDARRCLVTKICCRYSVSSKTRVLPHQEGNNARKSGK